MRATRPLKVCPSAIIKHRGLCHTFFLSKETVKKKQDHRFQNPFLVKIINIDLLFIFDIVMKSVVAMH
jgi:hypothetical protein